MPVGTRRAVLIILGVMCSLCSVSLSDDVIGDLQSEWRRIAGTVSAGEQQVQVSLSTATEGDTSEKVTTRWMDKNWYFSRTSEAWKFEYEEGFDGRTTRVLRTGKGGAYAAIHPGRYYNPEMTATTCERMPFQFSYGLLGYNLADFGFSAGQVKWPSGPLVGWSRIYMLCFAGKPENPGLLTIEAVPADPDRYDRFVLEIDPKLGYAVVSRKRYTPSGQIRSEAAGEQYYDVGGGVFVPKVVRGVDHMIDDSGGRNLRPVRHVQFTVHLDSMTVKPAFGSDSFQVVFPPGATVRENSTGMAAQTAQENITASMPSRSVEQTTQESYPACIAFGGEVKLGERVRVPIVAKCDMLALTYIAFSDRAQGYLRVDVWYHFIDGRTDGAAAFTLKLLSSDKKIVAEQTVIEKQNRHLQVMRSGPATIGGDDEPNRWGEAAFMFRDISPADISEFYLEVRPEPVAPCPDGDGSATQPATRPN